MITEQQANAAANSNKKKQDRQIPFLINMGDARLIPNTPGNRKLQNYRPYTGKSDAELGDRLRWLTLAAPSVRRLVGDEEDVEEFDINKAAKGELLDYARTELQMLDVSEDTDIRTLRKQIRERYDVLHGKLS